ncbi:hypothetical protein HGRIS_003513 [Hohenbuehelia grisea]|uniref:Cytochrome P450 n=1 Tax=Hohenbuehelia grisea TaxID=104357 RepID=A0ABR3JG97_9AGAR
MRIPKGTMVIANLRGMSLDESVYADPTKFHPARFLRKPEGSGEPFFSSAFGFGRRVCPGRHLATSGLWIVVATILATSTISKAVDEDGKDIDAVPEFTHGLATRPKPFPCDVRIRFDSADRLLD